jgi:hypothetical protein
VHIAKDNKDFYNTHLTTFFSELNQMEDKNLGGLILAYPADMCSQCKTVKTGVAMKLSTYACYCCEVHKNDLAKANKELCGDCSQSGCNTCYHHPILEEGLLHNLCMELEDLTKEWPHLVQYPFNSSKIKLGSSRETSVDPRNIEYEPQTVQQCIQYSNMIREEIRLRGISNANLATPEQRLLLYEVLIMEHRYSLLKGLCELKAKEEAMILLEKAVPCLLQLENRVSECIIQMVFLEALSYIEDDNHATMEYILSMECYMNKTIFGEYEAPSGWKFPYESNKLGEVKFSNWGA